MASLRALAPSTLASSRRSGHASAPKTRVVAAVARRGAASGRAESALYRKPEQPRRGSVSASRRRGAVAARAASGGALGDARLAALLAAIEEAKALSARRDAASDDDEALFADASALAARLEEAERENDALLEKVAELTALNDDAAAELLEDAAELAAALARAEDLEEEAEALRVLNERLAQAAEEVAAMVVADDASSHSTETHLEKLRAEADTAKQALATAERRAKDERDALLSRVRALEVDLAEAEAEAVGGDDAASPDALASAREKIERLSALAAQRGDALLQAEAAAAAAAAEVSSLKKRLASASAAGASADANLLATIRALETEMASMLTEEESAARVRELEIAMAEMVDAEEMDALLAHARAVETRMAEMVDASALAEAESRAAALAAEADALRARVRALETEMASMSYDDEAGPVAAEDAARGATAAAVSAFAAAPAKTKKASGRETPFARDPKATFAKRAPQFAEKKQSGAGGARADAAAKPFERAAPQTFALRRRTFPASTRVSASTRAGASRPAERASGDAVTYAFGGDDDFDATAERTSSKPFERASPDAFILRRFDFPAVRARASSVARGSKPPFSRADGGAFVKRRLTFFDAAERPTLAVEGTASMPVGAFTRTPDTFKLRRFDFVKAKGARGRGEANANEAPERRAFRRARAGGFSLRRFKFHP